MLAFCSTSSMLTPSSLVDGAQDAENLLHHQRRQAEGRLVQQQQLRPQHQRARDREHLLLAAGQRARLLAQALLQAREIAEDALKILRHAARSRRV